MKRRKLNKSPVLGFCGFVIGYECKEKGIKQMECDKTQADAIIVPHHFSHKVTKNSCLNLLVLYKDKIRGAMLPIVITAALRIPMLSGRATEDAAFLSRFRVRRLCR